MRAERVRWAAATLGYEPSEIAKALRKNRTHTLGLLIGSITNRYFSSLTETVLDEAEQAGYRILLNLTRWDDEKGVDSMKLLQRLRVEGLFYASGFFPKERQYLQKLVARQYPVIMLQNNTQGIPTAGIDHALAIHEAVRHLAARRHPLIHLVVWKTRTHYDELLKRFFLSACRQCGTQAQIHHTGLFSDLTELSRQRPSALICSVPNGLRLFSQTASAIPNYSPDMVGIYDEWNFVEHPKELCGAIIVQAEKQIRLATRELIQQIEHSSATRSFDLQSEFFRSDQFGLIRDKDLTMPHLTSF